MFCSEKLAIHSVERTLHLLLSMEEAGRLMGLTELSRATHLPKATVQRLLNVLEQYGFAEIWQGKYHIGIAILPLANAFLISKELIRIALPVLQLAQTSEEQHPFLQDLVFTALLYSGSRDSTLFGIDAHRSKTPTSRWHG